MKLSQYIFSQVQALKFQVVENNHTHPTEGKWKF